MLDRHSPVPLYHQLKALILEDIEGGRWKPGDQIPTEEDLSQRFGVSKITVRQALRELTTRGYIRREQGRGTFVQPRRLEEGPRALTSFSEEMRHHGLSPTSEVLEQGVVGAPPDVAAALGVNPGDPVFRLRRLRLADGEPMGVQTAYISVDMAPGIQEIAFRDASLYDVLRLRYDLDPVSARETHMATAVRSNESMSLGVPVGSPALAAERVTYLSDGRPLEYVQSIMRGDRYKVVLELVKQPAAR